jgi:tetratricopeptide (TPR) repeat protein
MLVGALAASTLLGGQSGQASGQQPPSPPAAELEPPEEDSLNAPKEYAFNPLQASKELKVGGFYFKKGSYRAALRRFEEALKWNPSLSEAYLRIGETQLKLRDSKLAKEAFQKYLELEPESKDAAAVKKRIASLN